VRYAALGGYRQFFVLNKAWIKSSFLKVYVVNHADRAALDVLLCVIIVRAQHVVERQAFSR